MTSDEYRALITDAHDALRALLRESEPGTGIVLHSAVSELRRWLEKEDERETRAEQPEREQEQREDEYRRMRYWKTLSHATRSALLFQALGDESLTIAEITERIQGLVQADGNIFESNIRFLVYRMYKERELDRSAHYHGQRVYYRYFKRTDLSGPIAELERHFRDTPAEDS